ncbi:MAG: hypothetical protein AB7G13_34845 [Lautropia sp.]
MAQDDRPVRFSLYEQLQVGDKLGPLEYDFTEAHLQRYRLAVGDPEAVHAIHAKRHIAALYMQRFPQALVAGLHNCHETEYFDRPRPGDRLVVTGEVVDKYVAKDKPYVVSVAEVARSDGTLIERIRETWMCDLAAAGRKWW